jgi:CHAT domain-containing protein/tetratricopeptide (TPR) repeat protein
MAKFLFGHIKKRPLQPIGSTESPSLIGKPDIDSALDVFLSAKNWRDAIDVLGTQEAVLLTDDARKVLLQRIKQLRKHSPKDDSVKKLRLYLRLLDEVRAHGIDAGWDSFFFYLVRRHHPIRWAVLQLIFRVFPPMQRKMKELSKQVLQQNLPSNSPSHGDEESDPRVTELVRASQNKSAILLEFVKFRRVLNELDELDEANEDYLDAVEARKIALLTDLTVRAKHPTIRAYAQVKLGQALSRYAGSSDLEDKIGMLEQAIEHFKMAAQTFDRNRFPLNWATVQMNFADASLVLAQARDEGGGRQQAVIYLEQALEVFTRDQFPEQWAQIHHKLGVMYTKQTYGDPAENLEQAIDHYQLALEVFTRDEKHLRDWAITQWFLGNAYRTRIWGDRRQNLEEAVACYDRALDFFTFETFAFYDEIHTQRSFALEQLGKLAEAHASLMAVRAWQHKVIERGNSIAWIGHSINERASGDIYERDAWILLGLSPSNLEKVVEVLEEGRAQAQRVALNLDSLEPARIKDPLARARAEAFIHARNAWYAAQKEIQTSLPQHIKLGDAQAIKMQQDRHKALEEAHAAFARARDAIRQHDIEDFLSPALSFSQIAQTVDHSDEALIYLVAGEQEGMAVVVMCDQQGHPCVNHLALPNLQEEAVINLHVEAEERFVREGDKSFPLGLEPAGGLALAQATAGFQYLFKWGTSVCDAINNLPPHSGLRLAGQALLQQWREDPYLYDLLKETIEDLNKDDAMKLMEAFAAEHLSVELERSSQKLGELGLSDLAIWLQKQQIHKMTLIPYGRLGFFPLPAVVIQTEEGKKTWLGDLFEVTLAPSAQALKKAKERAANLDPTKRPQILSAGNPQPLTTEYASLPFAEAEAQNTRRIAEKFRAGPACCLTGDTVTKKRMIDELEKAWLAHLALHGQFYFDAPRKSRLILAGNEELPEADRTISLDECLSGALNLVGMRLLVLSACETSLIDFQAMNEMIGIAAGFLQAGAAGVIASLWKVNDQATYLLMSRFMQLFLDPAHRDWTPAYCLAAAQRWLREEATNKILATYDPARLEGTQQTGRDQPATFSNLEHTSVAMGALERPYSKLYPLEKIQFQARKRMQSEPEALPYADPFYWAAFVMIGC